VALVAGAFASSLLCIGHATYISLSTHFTFDNFIYAQLSFLLHPSYYAMYLNLAVVVCMIHLEKKWNEISNSKKAAIASLILYLTIFILFVNSKAGILITAITFLIMLIRLMVVKRKYVLGGALLLLMFLAVAIVWTKVPYVKARFQGFLISVSSYNKDTKNSSEGTTERILVWQNAIIVALENMPIGVGTGDVNAALKESYEMNSFAEGAKRQFNAHNQYLQNTIAIGIPGLLCLLLILGTLFHRGLQSDQRLVFYFALIIALNFLVESMLETQAGVVFVAFFVSFFSLKPALVKETNIQ
jgi:O-antigen ligase